MKIEPYLNFNGRCDEAVEFYKKALGAEVLMRSAFKDAPDPEMLKQMPPGTGDKVMHVTMKIGDSIVMASDGKCAGAPTFEGISLSLAPSSLQEAEKLFAGLSQGGQVLMPLTKTFWSPGFGMLSDKFGVHWMVNVPGGPH